MRTRSSPLVSGSLEKAAHYRVFPNIDAVDADVVNRPKYTAKLISTSGMELLVQEFSRLSDAIRWFRALNPGSLSASAEHVAIFADGKLVWRQRVTELRERALKETARRILKQI